MNIQSLILSTGLMLIIISATISINETNKTNYGTYTAKIPIIKAE